MLHEFIFPSDNAIMAGLYWDPLTILLNCRFGDNYWMVDFYVKCDFTRDDGWFDVKGYPVIDGIGKWENPFDYDLHNECYDGPLSPLSHNHKAKCGMLNVFHFSEHNSEDSYCSVTSIPEDANIMA